MKFLARDLHNIGIRRGDTLLIHSSLGSLRIEGPKAKILYHAIKQCLGPEGTLLVPSLSYEEVSCSSPIFRQGDSPACTGGFSEYCRHHSDFHRSIHPTHSFLASGPKHSQLLDAHHLDSSPCGPHSPLRKLPDFDGKILFLGCGPGPNTSMHAVEELHPPPYLFGKTCTFTIITKSGYIYTREYSTHNFAGCRQRYDRLIGLLKEGEYNRTKIAGADSYLINARPLWEAAQKKLQEDPLYFVDVCYGQARNT